MYDLIGDIHGYADELQQLLKKLGYTQQKGVYRHPDSLPSTRSLPAAWNYRGRLDCGAAG